MQSAQDTSWAALTTPGDATDYFDLAYKGVPDVSGGRFDLFSAWFFSEVSRLVYRDLPGPSRADILSAVGYVETQAVAVESSFAIVLEPLSAADGRPAIVAIRGSQDISNWISNFDVKCMPCEGGGAIHRGFDQALGLISPELKRWLRTQRSPLVLTGHSLGAALAMAILTRLNVPPAAVYTYGAPRVGDAALAHRLRGMPIYRVVNASDIVPTLPPTEAGFEHAGALHFLTQDGDLLVGPDARYLRRSRLRAAADMDDLATRLQSSEPHRMLYEHSPINYSIALGNLLPR